MIKVSNEYIELMKQEINNTEHKYSIYNKTRDLDLTDLLLNDTLLVSRFLRTANGSISPNTVNLKLRANGNIPVDAFVKEFKRRYREFKGLKWKNIIYIETLDEYLVRVGDLIEIKDTFNGETLTIFVGNVKEITKTDTNNGREVDVKVDDNTIKGHEYYFADNLSFENYYIYNKNDKEHSLLYILCTEYLDFEKDKLMIEDIKNENGEYIKIPLATFKKESRVMGEIAEIVRSVYGNIYTMPDGSLKINSIFSAKDRSRKLDITLGNKQGNHPVLYFIENTTKAPIQNMVEVKYSNTVVNNKEVVFSLRGQNADKNNARIIVRSNTKGIEYWKIEFKNVIEVEKKPIVEAYVLNNGEKSYDYTDYELEFLTENTARVKFNNNTNQDVYITKFEFMGKPLSIYSNNTVTYTEYKGLTAKDTNLKSVSYKYIVSKAQAISVAKHTFYNECRTYNLIKLRTNNMPFLELEDIIKLDFKKYKGDFQIIAINQHNEYSELVLKEFRDYIADDENIITEKMGNSDIGNGGIVSKADLEKNKNEITKLDTKVNNLIKDLNDKISNLESQIKNQENVKDLVQDAITKRDNQEHMWRYIGNRGNYDIPNWRKILIISIYNDIRTVNVFEKAEIEKLNLYNTDILTMSRDNNKGYEVIAFIKLFDNRIEANNENIDSIYII